MTLEEHDARLGRSVREYDAAQRELEDKLHHIREIGNDFAAFGQWLQQYKHGRVAKEPLSRKRNITENVTIRMTFSYLLAGITDPVPSPVGYRWGRRCQLCDVSLTPRTANPANYRQCRLCRAMTIVGRGSFFRFLWRNCRKWGDDLI